MIRLENLHIQVGNFTLSNINMIVEQGDYFILLGPTGAGKTVLLESIAGIHRIREGKIWLRGEDVTSLEPEKRETSIVYQDFCLFPHLSVKENILFGLKLRKTKVADMNNILEKLVNLLNIAQLLERRPETLSGGERQKVALTRALAIQPDVLLLDEPLGALDPASRETVRDELRQLHSTLGITTIHVTHDFEEAMSLGNRVAVIGDGQLKQVGTPEQVFYEPNSEFVARFAMTRNIFEGEVRHTSGETMFTTMGTNIKVSQQTAEGRCLASLRPEEVLITLQPENRTGFNCFASKINHIVDRGSTLLITVNVPLVISSLITRHSFKELALVQGTDVYISFAASSVHVFDE
jgi:ABC-type Fe3+/spermidine/putrescine transport system ATPase subunit